MTTNWFISDTHFGHANIIKYAKRPFDDVQEMDDKLIANWNHLVSPHDNVYHMGDFTLGGTEVAQRYFSQLNGRIFVLSNLWHHDRRWLPDEHGESNEFFSGSGYGIEILPPLHVLSFPEYGTERHAQAVVLCHYPLREWDRSHYGAWHLFGHNHGVDGPARRDFSLNVCVDHTGYKPVSLQRIAGIMLARGWFAGWSLFEGK